MSVPDILVALQPVINALEKLSVPYFIGGSIASSLYGMARATIDVDIIAAMQKNHVQPFKNLLENDYFLDAKMIEEAILRSTSFNLIHLSTMIKIDIFIQKNDLYSITAFKRKRKDTLEETRDAKICYFSSPEDVILHKLHWYELGERVSHRQWLDVLGVIKVQALDLDKKYLLEWGKKLGLLELLQKAFLESGVEFE